MRTLFFRKSFAALTAGFLLFAVSACNKNTTTVPVVNSSSSISAIIKNGNNLTILDTILVKTGYFAVLDSVNPNASITAPYTLFTATDADFATAGIVDSTLYKFPTAALNRLLLYSLISGYGLTSATLPKGPNAKIPTAGGDSVFVTVNTNGIFVNGVQVSQPDIIAANGVLHAMSAVLIPPAGSIYQTLQRDSTLSFFVAALNRTGANLDSMLSSGGIYTLFVPTNSAFPAYNSNDSSIAVINGLNTDSLTALINRHIVQGRVFSSDFVAGGQITTLQAGDSITFYPTNSTTLVQKGDTTFSTIRAVNIMASNGVIHKIDQVLVP
jgi:uncharacterized surface protein with fasciclin (FAS1) repeats